MQDEYQIRLNRAIDYILNHYSKKLSLEKIAQIACLSKYHFHRIFHAMMGETLNDFILRTRLEKSVHLLIRNMNKSIIEIAFDCGFSCSQNYAKAFKTYCGMTPSSVRKKLNWDELKIKIRNFPEEKLPPSQRAEAYLRDIFFNKHHPSVLKILKNKSVPQVTIMNVPEIRVAYIRTRGPYNWDSIQPSFKKLYQWAASKELLTENAKFLGVMRNLTTITTSDKLLHDACITVPAVIKEDRWVNIQTLPGGKIAVYYCEPDINQVNETWLHFILNWLIFSDFQPDNRPLYNILHNDFLSPRSRQHHLDLCLPIKPLYE